MPGQSYAPRAARISLSGTDPIRVLVTRPLPQGERTAARLTAMGYTPILAPMLRIDPITPPDLPDFSALQAVLITSANGVQRLAALTPLRTIPLLTVGDRTAKTAQNLGFQSIQSAQGDGDALLALAQETLTPNAGAILHIRGKDAAVSFETLAQSGFSIDEAITYEAIQADTLPAAAISPPPEAALIYSARTAQAFAAALRRSPLNPSQLTLIGISPASLLPLAETPLRCIAADAPTEDALLNALAATLPPPEKN